MQFRIECDRDRVLILLPSGTRDFALQSDQAERFAENLDTTADWCAAWVSIGGGRELWVGPHRGADVKAYAGKVCVRLDTPTACESIPFEDARKLARLVRRWLPAARQQSADRPVLAGVP